LRVHAPGLSALGRGPGAGLRRRVAFHPGARKHLRDVGRRGAGRPRPAPAWQLPLRSPPPAQTELRSPDGILVAPDPGRQPHPDEPDEGDWFESVADIARVHRLPLFTPPSPNLPAIVETLRALAADVILSVWYRRLLGSDLLALPRVAALNLHGSLLPAYRGRAPVNWVLVNGERRTGVTLHHMAGEADAGDIVAQQAIDIEPDDTAFTLYKRMVKI